MTSDLLIDESLLPSFGIGSIAELRQILMSDPELTSVSISKLDAYTNMLRCKGGEFAGLSWADGAKLIRERLKEIAGPLCRHNGDNNWSTCNLCSEETRSLE